MNAKSAGTWLAAGVAVAVIASCGREARAPRPPMAVPQVAGGDVSIAWRFDAEGAYVVSMCADHQTVLLVLEGPEGPPFKQRLVKVSAATGDVEWTRPLHAHTTFTSLMAISDATIAVQLADLTGRTQRPAYWTAFFDRDDSDTRFALDNPFSAYDPFGAGDVILRVDAYAGDDAAHARAVDQNTGRELWEYTTPGRLLRRIPLLSSSRILLPWMRSARGLAGERWTVGVDCLEAETGHRLWRHTVEAGPGIEPTVATDGAHVYLGYARTDGARTGGEGSGLDVSCLSSVSGRVLWERTHPTADVLVATPGAVFGFTGRSGTGEGWRLWRAGAKTGELGYVTTGNPGFDLSYASWVRPAVLAESYLVLGAKRKKGPEHGEPSPVVCIDLDSGKVAGQWQFVAGVATLAWGPLSGGDRVYFREDDTHVVALKLTPRATTLD